MPAYLQVGSSGEIILPADILDKAKLKEGDLLEAIVDVDGMIRLVPKLAIDRVLAEQYQLDGMAWARKQKGQRE